MIIIHTAGDHASPAQEYTSGPVHCISDSGKRMYVGEGYQASTRAGVIYLATLNSLVAQGKHALAESMRA